MYKMHKNEQNLKNIRYGQKSQGKIPGIFIFEINGAVILF
jgi:hypothetical protein